MTINMPANAEEALSQLNQTIYMLKKAKRSHNIVESKIADLVEDPVINLPAGNGNDLLRVEEKITSALGILEAINSTVVRHLLSKVTWEPVSAEVDDDD